MNREQDKAATIYAIEQKSPECSVCGSFVLWNSHHRDFVAGAEWQLSQLNAHDKTRIKDILKLSAEREKTEKLLQTIKDVSIKLITEHELDTQVSCRWDSLVHEIVHYIESEINKVV